MASLAAFTAAVNAPSGSSWLALFIYIARLNLNS
ncbi:Uncharacterised protein [Mycobacterium tuberculosis]|nr:Uncharacterised protein [Mycobacterium tuberculosis]